METRALAIYTEAHKLDMPKPAILLVRANGLGLFYASDMQSHNGYTVFNECLIPEEIYATIKENFRIISNNVVTKRGQPLFDVDCNRRPCKCLCHDKVPLLVIRTDNVLEARGLASLDRMLVWSGMDRDSALAKVNAEQIEENNRTAQSNSTIFTACLVSFMVDKIKQVRSSMPWYTRLFKRDPIREAEIQMETKGPFFRQCAWELAHADQIEFDRPFLIQSLGFDPWKDQ